LGTRRRRSTGASPATDAGRGKITEVDLYLANLTPVELAPRWFSINAPHFVLSYIGPTLEMMFGRQALYRGGLKVTTSLDLDLQKKGEAILDEWITTFEYSGGHNGSLVAMDPAIGEVLTYVGSRLFRDDISARTTWRALQLTRLRHEAVYHLTAFMNPASPHPRPRYTRLRRRRRQGVLPA
jgi:membrane peptidoglycan carboxypeptidase